MIIMLRSIHNVCYAVARTVHVHAYACLICICRYYDTSVPSCTGLAMPIILQSKYILQHLPCFCSDDERVLLMRVTVGRGAAV